MIGNEAYTAFRQFLSIAVQIICNYAVFVFATLSTAVPVICRGNRPVLPTQLT